MLEGLQMFLARFYVWLTAGRKTVKHRLASERGDTNFISIIIILGIVIVLAGVFIGFREQIVDTVKGVVNNFGAASLGTPGS